MVELLGLLGFWIISEKRGDWEVVVFGVVL